MRFESIGCSNGGIDIPNLRITNRNRSGEFEAKPIICIVGRQHSGETHSSFIIHGFLNFLISKDPQANKLREKYEFWVMPIINPDGVIAGNYRCNTQGRDMNRHFFSDDDPEGLKMRLTEVELVRSYLKEKVPKDEDGDHMLKMFLDIHAHSACNSIFAYCPWVDEPPLQAVVKRFPMILDNSSAFFQFDNCKFGNEKYKRNCARLGVHRDFNLINCYTIESSCYGYEVKGTDEVEQFKEYHFLKFGEHLAFGIAKHFSCEVTEIDIASMSYGFDIDLDYGLYMKEQKENKKSKRRRQKDTEKVSKKNKRTVSNMGMRES